MASLVLVSRTLSTKDSLHWASRSLRSKEVSSPRQHASLHRNKVKIRPTKTQRPTTASMAGDLRINAALLAGPGEFILFFASSEVGDDVNVGAGDEVFQTKVLNFRGK